MPPKRKKAMKNARAKKKVPKLEVKGENFPTSSLIEVEIQGKTELLQEMRKNKETLLCNKPQFTCKLCNKKFKFKKSYKMHMSDEHSDLPTSVPCPQCIVRCPNKDALAAHKAKVHDRDIFECPTCAKTFVRHAHVLRHMAQTGCSGKGVVVFPCEICKAEFTRKDNLMVHLRLQHIERKPFVCKLCNYSTRAFSKYVLHNQTGHTEGKLTLECDHCGKTTSSRASMAKHLEIHGEKKYSCDVCNYSTYTVEVIRRHVLTHVEEKPYKCSQCAASFIQMAQLRRHRLRHENCCDVCNKGFDGAASLAIHMAQHQPAKDDGTTELLCPIKGCTSAFKNPKALKIHIKKDHDERPYACEVCGKRYRKEGEMRRHVASHTLERPRRCMYCVAARAYVRGLALVRHVRKQHPAVFRDHLRHVRSVLGIATSSERVKKSEMDSILSVLDAEADRIIDGYGEGVLYGGMMETSDDTPTAQKPIKTEDSPLMTEEELAKSLSQLLYQLIDRETLQCFGWPDESVDVVLEKVIEQCGAKPADREKWTRVQRLRENAKHLFLHVVEDKTVSRMLETHTIDQIVKYILAKVSEDNVDLPEYEEDDEVSDNGEDNDDANDDGEANDNEEGYDDENDEVNGNDEMNGSDNVMNDNAVNDNNVVDYNDEDRDNDEVVDDNDNAGDDCGPPESKDFCFVLGT